MASAHVILGFDLKVMPADLDIVLVENNASDATAIDSALRRTGGSIKLRRVETVTDFEACLQQCRPDVVLCNFSLPGGGAFAALNALRKSGADPPFILLSSNSIEEPPAEFLQLGAQRLVKKDQLELLAPVIERELAAARARAAEASVARAEARFRAFVQNSNEGIILMDPAGQVTFASESVARVAAYRPEQLIGRNGFDFLHPDDVSAQAESFAEFVRQPGSMRKITVRARHGDGTWHWIESIETNLLDDPNVGAIVANFQDLTEQRRTEEKLRKSERLVKALLEKSTQGVLLLDAEGKIRLTGA